MSSSKHISIISLLLMHSYCFSLPTNEVIIAGDAQFQHQENALNVIQSSDFLHTQYDTFDIANHESVTFQQPNINSVVINQVLNSDPTSIAGQLSANGQLFILAPGGLIIHDGASVEAASFFSSTLAVDKVTNSDIQLSASHSSHGIINNGNISINGGGSLQLLSNKIINNGTIENKNGDVKLAVSDSALVRFSGDMFAMELDEFALDGVIQNSGVISATSGNVQLNAMVRNQINELVIHNEGHIVATSAWQEGGDIYIGSNEGDIENHGLIESVATANHDQLSHIQINSDRIANFGTIKNNAADTGDAGSIELNAEEVVVLMAGSLMQANGDVAGDGGNIKVFSPKNAIFRQGANIEAQAGFHLGNGGFVDVSGWEYIEINGRVSTLALNGENGEFLIDPYNVTISTTTNNNSFSGGTFTPTLNGSTISVLDLVSNLQSGDVTIVTTGGGAENGDISLSVALNLDGTDGNTLSLIAEGSILLNASISDNNPATADATNIVLQALNGSITPGANTVESGGGSIELKTNGNVTIGTGGNIDLTKFDSEGGSLTVESTAGTLSLLSDFDLDGYNGNTINFKASSDINLDFDVRDLTTASADSVGLGFISTSGDVLLAGGKVVQSSGGAISIEAAPSITVGTGGYVDLANFDSEGGSLTIESTGGALTLLNDLDLNGRAGSILTLAASTDLNLNFNITDSVTGSADSVALSLMAGNDINIAAGKSVNSYGNLITFNANNNIALTNVTTGGGALFLSAINITDAGDTGSGYDIDAGGGVVSFNYSGDVGGSSTATAIEINDSIIDLSFYGSAQNFFVSAAGAQDLTIRDVDYNGTTTFNFNGSHTGTGSFNFSGDFSDSNDSGDVATINVNTTGVASHINVASSASLRTRGGDLTFITADATSNITIGSSAVARSQGGDITYNAGGDIGITYTRSDTGAINLTAQNIYDNGNVRSDIVADGGVVTINASGNVGGTSSTTGLEIEDATIDFTATGSNQNMFLNALGSNALTFNSIDYNGIGTFNLGVRHDGAGDIIVDGIIDDSDTGTVDSATFDIQTTSVTGDFLITNGSSIRSRSGDIAINVLGDASLSKLWSDGGAISITADNIIDSGSTNADINASGSLVTLNATGNIGSTAYTSAIEINDAILDIVASGTNQNVYIINNGAAGLTINDIDYNGTGTFNVNLRAVSTGDLTVTGQITDSVAGGDMATINLETQNAASDIILDNATVRSYGGDITYNSAATLGVTNTQTDGGALTITATDVYDNGGGVDINTQGGLATFNVSGNIGVSGANAELEMQDSVLSGVVGTTNAIWNFKSVAASSYLTLSDFDYNGATGFTLSALANGGTLNVTGTIADSDALSDSATISLQTTLAGSDIVMSDGSVINSNGGSITYDSADELGLSQTLSNGGAINITAAGNIYDNNTGDDLSSNGGLITFNPAADIGGTGLGIASAIDIYDSLIDLNITNNSQSIYFNIDNTDSYLNINTVDYNGGNGLTFDVLAQNGADITVTGDLFDSDTASVESATITLSTDSTTSDITIDNGATIRSGDGGSIVLTSANDIYLTGVFGGAGATVVTAGNDIIDNGDITLDIQSTGIAILEAGRHMADVGTLRVSATSLHLNLGSGNHNIMTIGSTELGSIEVNGASGAALSVLGSSGLNVTGSISDSVGEDDLIDLSLGTSSGFITLPDGGYTVPGSLTILAGTEGIQDNTDERISITANSVISSGNNFLSNTGPVIFDLTVDDIDFRDDSGTVSFEINNSKNMRIVDLDGDGEFLLGKEFKLNVNGDLAVPTTFINDVDNQLWIIADDIDDPDADNIITIRDSGDAGSDFNLIVELTGANDVHINTEISHFDGTVAAGGTLTIANNFGTSNLNLASDLNSDGAFINGAGNLILATQGTLTLADDGIHTAGHLFLTADDIMDSDNEISLSGANVFLQLDAPTSNLYTLNLTADKFDATLTGSNNGLVVNASQDLFIQDLNSDGNSLYISDGYAWIDVAGSVSLDNTISIIDSNVDGTENGWMYLGYEGSAQLGMNGGLTMQIDGSLEAGTPGALDVANSQLIIRQTGASNISNTLQLDDANITVTGGDAIFDITNNTGNVTGYGDIQTSTNTAITVLNAAGDTPLTQPTYDGLSINGSLNVATGRAIGFNGYNLAIAEPEPEPEPDNEINDQINDAVADVINETVEDSGQTVTNDIQEETVDSVESTPNVNFALNATYGDCQASNKDDPRCRLKDEMSRFLGQFLMGGSMIKAK